MPDVIVVGAGNAAICAAMAAKERGADVVVLEKAERGERGGNTFFTGGGFRFPYRGIDDIRALMPDLSDEELARIEVGSYTEADMRADLMRVTESQADPAMVGHLVANAYDTVQWMSEQYGQRWVLMYGRQAYEVDDKLVFWGGMITEAVGGGEGLSEGQFQAAERAGIEVRYGAGAAGLLTHERTGHITGVRIRTSEGFEALEAPSVVLAAGGFEANVEMRTRYLGAGWEFAKVRGTRHNTGEVIRQALDIGRTALRPLVQRPRRRLGPQRPAHRQPPRRRPLPEALVPARSDRQHQRRALRRRGAPISATTPTPSTAARSSSSPTASPSSSSINRPSTGSATSTASARSPRARATPSPSSPATSASTRTASSPPSSSSTPPASPASSTPPSATASTPRASIRRSPTGRSP